MVLAPGIRIWNHWYALMSNKYLNTKPIFFMAYVECYTFTSLKYSMWSLLIIWISDLALFPIFQNLTCLSAAALGVFQASERLSFDTWILPSLKRLRLETMEPLSLSHLQSLKLACSKLESLHLISGTHATVRESHICPLTDDTILEYLNNF